MLLVEWNDVVRALSRMLSMKEKHLLRTLGAYQVHYNESRAHYSLDSNAPIARRVQAAGGVRTVCAQPARL